MQIATWSPSPRYYEVSEESFKGLLAETRGNVRDNSLSPSMLSTKWSYLVPLFDWWIYDKSLWKYGVSTKWDPPTIERFLWKIINTLHKFKYLESWSIHSQHAPHLRVSEIY